ncbi:MAG: hypothetical protein V1777_01675 [Candidatus Micrarchaeota archaeon]
MKTAFIFLYFYAWFEAIEEPKIRKQFQKLDNAYLTPHFGWMTPKAQARLRKETIQNIKSYLNGIKTNRIA